MVSSQFGRSTSVPRKFNSSSLVNMLPLAIRTKKSFDDARSSYMQNTVQDPLNFNDTLLSHSESQSDQSADNSLMNGNKLLETSDSVDTDIIKSTRWMKRIPSTNLEDSKKRGTPKLIFKSNCKENEEFNGFDSSESESTIRVNASLLKRVFSTREKGWQGILSSRRNSKENANNLSFKWTDYNIFTPEISETMKSPDRETDTLITAAIIQKNIKPKTMVNPEPVHEANEKEGQISIQDDLNRLSNVTLRSSLTAVQKNTNIIVPPTIENDAISPEIARDSTATLSNNEPQKIVKYSNAESAGVHVDELIENLLVGLDCKPNSVQLPSTSDAGADANVHKFIPRQHILEHPLADHDPELFVKLFELGQQRQELRKQEKIKCHQKQKEIDEESDVDIQNSTGRSLIGLCYPMNIFPSTAAEFVFDSMPSLARPIKNITLAVSSAKQSIVYIPQFHHRNTSHQKHSDTEPQESIDDELWIFLYKMQRLMIVNHPELPYIVKSVFGDTSDKNSGLMNVNTDDNIREMDRYLYGNVVPMSPLEIGDIISFEEWCIDKGKLDVLPSHVREKLVQSGEITTCSQNWLDEGKMYSEPVVDDEAEWDNELDTCDEQRTAPRFQIARLMASRSVPIRSLEVRKSALVKGLLDEGESANIMKK
jgi:hypothetical protein